jgi:hypothetical protein
MSSLFGGSSPQAASPPPFSAVSIPQATNLATAYDTLGYNLSDQDFLARFPGLVSLRDSNIQDIADQITGPLDPTVQNVFAGKGMSDALSAFGGNTGSIGGAGSAARGAITASMANSIQNKQDYDRLALQSAIQANPERQFGPTGSDLVNLMIGNVVGQNQRNYQAYAGQVSQANAAQAAGQSELFGGIQLGVSLLGIAL